MEYIHTIRRAARAAPSAASLNPARRELVVGTEDGTVKSFDLETHEEGEPLVDPGAEPPPPGCSVDFVCVTMIST